MGSMNFEALCTFGTDKARRGKGSRVDSNCSRKEKPVNDRKKKELAVPLQANERGL